MEMERNGGSSKSSSEGHPLTVREYESKKDKCENITVTDQSKVKRRHHKTLLLLRRGKE